MDSGHSIELASGHEEVVDDVTLPEDAQRRSESGSSSPLVSQDGLPLIFRLRFIQGMSFKVFTQNLNNVLQFCSFEVQRRDDFQGLAVEACNDKKNCMVVGRLSGSVELEPDVTVYNFCVKMDVLMSCLRTTHAQHFVELSVEKGGNELILRSYEPDIISYAATFKIRLQAFDNGGLGIDGLIFSYYVEMDLIAFREAIRTANEQRAASMSLMILEPKAAALTDSRKRTSFFVMRSKADNVDSTFPYQSTTVQDSGPNQPRSIRVLEQETGGRSLVQLPSLDMLDTKYVGEFSPHFLNLFVKSMERSVLTFRLGPNQPLVLECSCDASSYLRFILAAMADV
jgi:hypothetical protein